MGNLGASQSDPAVFLDAPPPSSELIGQNMDASSPERTYTRITQAKVFLRIRWCPGVKSVKEAGWKPP